VRMLQQLFAHRVNQDLVTQLVVGRERQLAVALFKLASATHAEATLGYVLRFLADLCQLCPSLVREFAVLDAPAVFGVDPVTVFADFSEQRNSLGVFNPAIFLFAAVLSYAPTGEVPVSRPAATQKFLATCTTVMSAAELNVATVEYVIHAVCTFLRCSDHRPLFNEAGLVGHIPRMLAQAIAVESASVVQLTYELLLCARLLTFNYDCMVELYKAKILPVVHRTLQKVTKEKCIRMAVYVVKNFILAQQAWIAHKKGERVPPAVLHLTRCNRNQGPTFFSDIIGFGMMKTIQQLLKKKYGDDDITAELEWAEEILTANLDDLTSFTEYLGELQSGVLEWSPVHTSTRFWQENCKKFEENQSAVLKELASLLTTSTNELTLSVACHDIGELVRRHPSGRQILDAPGLQGCKERIMTLMSAESPEVAKHALTAVQKILVDRA